MRRATASHWPVSSATRHRRMARALLTGKMLGVHLIDRPERNEVRMSDASAPTRHPVSEQLGAAWSFGSGNLDELASGALGGVHRSVGIVQGGVDVARPIKQSPAHAGLDAGDRK